MQIRSQALTLHLESSDFFVNEGVSLINYFFLLIILDLALDLCPPDNVNSDEFSRVRLDQLEIQSPSQRIAWHIDFPAEREEEIPIFRGGIWLRT